MTIKTVRVTKISCDGTPSGACAMGEALVSDRSGAAAMREVLKQGWSTEFQITCPACTKLTITDLAVRHPLEEPTVSIVRGCIHSGGQRRLSSDQECLWLQCREDSVPVRLTEAST